MMNRWALKAQKHWKKHLPRKYQLLQQQGTLLMELEAAGVWAADKIADLIEQGMMVEDAKEVVLPQYILLTPENSHTEATIKKELCA
ncbi:MAG: hypothetical protein JW795_20480 [Chitinivibrionales bacterium]|nr:hypothetical protein [Chitinivibrionales bacterium]